MSDHIYLLMGVQGAGKGTQAAHLAQHFGIPHISTGDIFRAVMKQNSPLGEELRDTLNAGRLVSDELTSRMVRERLAQPDTAGGFILDGYPRTQAQVEHLDTMLAELGKTITRVIFFDLPESETINRLSNRRVCTRDSSHIYHLTENPPRQPSVCDVDGAPLKQRDDDQPEAIQKRVSEYIRETLPLLEVYRQRDSQLVYNLNALQPIEQVTAELLAAAEQPRS